MSTLKVTTIQTSAGGPVTLTKQAAVKAHLLITDNSSFNSSNSLNISGITDTATGKCTVAFSTSFADLNYSPVGMGGENGSVATARMQNIGTMATGTHLILGHTTSALDDLAKSSAAYFGDLA